VSIERNIKKCNAHVANADLTEKTDDVIFRERRVGSEERCWVGFKPLSVFYFQ
jgi:hypothetical protein